MLAAVQCGTFSALLPCRPSAREGRHLARVSSRHLAGDAAAAAAGPAPLQPLLTRRAVCLQHEVPHQRAEKRIDIWLIYRCSACDGVWNLPIFERVGVGEIAPGLLDGFARNDPALALRHAFDRSRLLRHGAIEEFPDVSIHKARNEECEGEAGAIAIVLALAQPCGVRLDRLLRGGLGVSRAQLELLFATGALRLLPPTHKALRSPIVHGQTIAIDLVSLDWALAKALQRGALA